MAFLPGIDGIFLFFSVDGTVYTAKQIHEELAARFRSGNTMPFGGILFALLAHFDLDGPGVRPTTFRWYGVL